LELKPLFFLSLSTQLLQGRRGRITRGVGRGARQREKRNLGKLFLFVPFAAFESAESLLQAPTKNTVFVITVVVVVVAVKRGFSSTPLTVGGFIAHDGELRGLIKKEMKGERKEGNERKKKKKKKGKKGEEESKGKERKEEEWFERSNPAKQPQVAVTSNFLLLLPPDSRAWVSFTTCSTRGANSSSESNEGSACVVS